MGISIVSNLFATAVCVITFLIRPQNVWVYVALQGMNWLALVLWFWYPLHKKQVDENVAELARRRGE